MPDEIPPSSETPSMPDVLYHYTSVNVLLEILKNRTIWATSMLYLNDYTEGEHFLDLVRSRLPQLLEKHNACELLSLINESKELKQRPFVASFSTQRNSLPQWRSYCPQGNGVAIGFRTSFLSRAFVPEAKSDASGAIELEKVIYTDGVRDSGDIDRLIRSKAKKFDEFIDQARNTNLDRKSRPYSSEDVEHVWNLMFSSMILSEASRRKHPSFEHECEYRLIIAPWILKPSHFNFRPVRSTLVPYVIVSIPLRSRLTEFPTAPDYLAEIIVGPTPNPDLTMDSLRALLEKSGMPRVAVIDAAIPFRDW